MAQTGLLKCAEVFRNKSGAFVLYCDYCMDELHTYEMFLDHMAAHFTIEQLEPDPEADEALQRLKELLVESTKYEIETNANDTSPLNDDSEDNVVDMISTYEEDFMSDEEVVGANHCNPTTLKQCPFPDCYYTGSFKEHLCRVHDNSSQLPFQCDICNKALHSMSMLERHRRCHERIKCPGVNCKRKFDHQDMLEQHFAAEHQPVKCDMCHQQFSSLQNMQRHREGHQRTFGCDICGKFFATKSGIRIHMVMHSGLKAFKCPEVGCQEAFKYSTNLLAHRRWHWGEDGLRYVCDQCGKAFNTHTKLRDHIKNIHLQIRDQQCPKCDKAFKDKAHLKLHFLRVHTNERPWKCRGCPMTYRNLDTRKAHERREHPEII